MTTIEMGKKLVGLSREGKSLEAIDLFYDEKIVSIEAQGSDEAMARIEGLADVRAKSVWWLDNHIVHEANAIGPCRGQSDDRFGVFFEFDVTFKPSGERSKLVEIALYTVENEKIVQEEFWSLVD